MRIDEEGKIKCPGCDERFPATQKYFYANSSSPDGLDNRCKVCRNTTTYEYRKTEKGSEQRRRSNRESRKKTEKARETAACGQIIGMMHKHADQVLRDLGLK